MYTTFHELVFSPHPLFLVLEGVSFGIADGVGGWVESGVDPSLFSQALMYHAHRYSRNAWAGEPEIDPTLDYEEREQIEGWEMTPYECLGLAYHGVLREKMVQAGTFLANRVTSVPLTFLSGSSTACIISLNAANGVLRSAKYVIYLQNSYLLSDLGLEFISLGDSGFAIIRSSSIFYRQRTQTHFFNCPKCANISFHLHPGSHIVLDNSRSSQRMPVANFRERVSIPPTTRIPSKPS